MHSQPLAMARTHFFVLIFITSLFRCHAWTLSKLTGAPTKFKDIGPQFTLPGTTAVQYSHPLTAPVYTQNSEPLQPFGAYTKRKVLSTVRQGTSFTINLNAPNGFYDIFIGFTPPSNCVDGDNVFHVSLGGSIILPSYDIVKHTKSCKTPVIESFSWIKLQPSSKLTFRAISGVASVSFILITAPVARCTALKVQNAPAHLAHSIPGKYPQDAASYIDRSSKGYRTVYMNGLKSHSHFPVKGRVARISSYTWSAYPSGRVLSRKAVFPYDFPLGTTHLSLEVVDEACDVSRDTTAVAVSTNVQSGAYCYFYEPMQKLPIAGTLGKSPKPVYSLKFPTAAFNFDRMGNHPVLKRNFVARCVFFIKFNKDTNAVFSMGAVNSGRATLYKDNGLIIDTAQELSSERLGISSGLASFELIYQRTSAKSPELSLKMNGALPRLLHDNSAIQTIISSISPAQASLTGGNEVMISGYGLFWPLKIRFGNIAVRPEWRGNSPTRVFVKTPKVLSSKVLPLSIETRPGIISNSKPFTFSNRCNALGFQKKQLTMKSGGGPVPIKLATSAALGNDGRLYIGSGEGKVHSLAYDSQTLKVMSFCSSPTLHDARYKKRNGAFAPRSVLGVALDPRDKTPRPYASVSTLLWSFQMDTRNKKGWSNGVVLRLVPIPKTPAGICLKLDKIIVSNLPVSPRDHAVNALVFTLQGDLLISLGGHTNAGLPSRETGGVWETYFSGSVVIARLSRGRNFNGIIPYKNPENSRTAVPVAGYDDVAFYATGLRNLFSMEMTRDGRIFGVDMGTNCGQGDVASACGEYVESKASKKNLNDHQLGLVIVDANARVCKKGPSRVDKILEIKQGKYYGHPNLQRAARSGAISECKWIDPSTNTHPDGSRPPPNYQRPVRMIYSAKTGVIEYGSRNFCDELRGDLLLSQYSEQSTWRLRMGKTNKQPQDQPFELIKGYSGIKVIENAHGDMLFPRHKRPGVFVSKANASQRNGLFASNAVPFLHGKNGGTTITIGGWGFQTPATVLVGGKKCTIRKQSVVEILCVVPARGGGRQTVDVKVVIGSQEALLEKAVLYMSV